MLDFFKIISKALIEFNKRRILFFWLKLLYWFFIIDEINYFISMHLENIESDLNLHIFLSFYGFEDIFQNSASKRLFSINKAPFATFSISIIKDCKLRIIRRTNYDLFNIFQQLFLLIWLRRQYFMKYWCIKSFITHITLYFWDWALSYIAINTKWTFYIFNLIIHFFLLSWLFL